MLQSIHLEFQRRRRIKYSINCKESYEVNELAELTKALAKLITARAKLE